jgi:DNA-binding FadR family transcriptional regulator
MSDIKLLSSFERPTQSSRVARHLLDLITREKLKPGDQVPSEVQIGQKLEISRGSVREAYRTLAALGILEIESGRRPRLQALNPAVLTQVFAYALKTAQVTVPQVMETRRAIEIQSVQLAAVNANEAQLRVLRELVAQMRSALADHARRIAADMAVHTTLAEASHNPLNALLLESLRAPLEESMFIDLGSRRTDAELVKIIDAHEAIVDRVCARDAVGAGAAMSYHFDLSVNTMLKPAASGAGIATDGASN